MKEEFALPGVPTKSLPLKTSWGGWKFLIGRLETVMKAYMKKAKGMFQFLIGRLETEHRGGE